VHAHAAKLETAQNARIALKEQEKKGYKKPIAERRICNQIRVMKNFGLTSRKKEEFERIVRKQFIAACRDQLTSRFPDLPLLEAFAHFFDPSRFPSDQKVRDQLANASPSLETLMSRYGKPHPRDDGSLAPALVDNGQLKQEWALFVQFRESLIPTVLLRYPAKIPAPSEDKADESDTSEDDEPEEEEVHENPEEENEDDDEVEELDAAPLPAANPIPPPEAKVKPAVQPLRPGMNQFLAVFLSRPDAPLLFKNLAILANIALVLPASTAACERGFSHLSAIKSKARNRLKQPALQDLMRVATCCPPNLSDADAQAAVRVWAEGSHRVTVRFAAEAKVQ
jgi:hypothetical protein